MPYDRAGNGTNPCVYKDLVGITDDIVEIQQSTEKYKGGKTSLKRSLVGQEAREAQASMAKERTIVACHCKTEPECWFLGRVLETNSKCTSATRGNCGEMLSKGLLMYVTVQKIQECVGGTSYYEELSGEEGEVRVPAQNIVAIDVVLVSRKMTRSEIARAMGDERADLSPAECESCAAGWAPPVQRWDVGWRRDGRRHEGGGETVLTE